MTAATLEQLAKALAELQQHIATLRRLEQEVKGGQG
jgi:prefoldin subunit 5